MNIPKIKDRVFLGMMAGVIANIPKILIDEVSRKMNISKRSFRETAAGIWVSTHKEATTPQGHLLGNMLDFGMAMFGGIQIVKLFSKTGRDHVLAKGLLFGTGMGSIITGLMSGLATNKVSPKDAVSNLSYLISHAAYGITAAYLISNLGHPSIFDVQPKNNRVEPTEMTTEQIDKREKAQYGINQY